MKSIYIKPSKRKCSASGYKCFDIFDQDLNKIEMEDCDVIDIRVPVMVEVSNGMIHIWDFNGAKVVQGINTLLITKEEW